MEQRRLGRTGLTVSVLGFGCGAVGGLMVRGAPADQERAVARAIELGISYFDTAASYGAGASERNLGRVLRALKPNITIGTKVGVPEADRPRIGAAVAEGLHASLQRLGRPEVDLFQLHNPITTHGGNGTLTPREVLEDVVPAMQRLQREGKTRCFGITAIGDAAALHEVVTAGVLDTMQLPYNLLNPSAAAPLPPGFPAHDFRGLMHAADIGVIGIRVLAAGALSGTAERHPIAAQNVDPIASGESYAVDLARAQSFRKLIEEGHATSLVEAALRFAITPAAVSTVLIGTATIEQLEEAAAAVEKGPLSEKALKRVGQVQQAIR